MNELIKTKSVMNCPKSFVLAVNDTLNVIGGKWKISIIASLLQSKMRFKDLQEVIVKITPRMLSKELKELELNGVVNRIVQPSKPVLIEYELTESGKQLSEVIDSIIDWGLNHRSVTINTIKKD
ncbi:helix-turn-helix domain-containing protein [Flavobacterium sp. CS20]|uniref:winged helix-turn-helix transcriptional regulator n=1 Tax=Flavobacterium sp. CS20 TaxID=2775246 RepID=UPI001B39DA3B|nr:helix-turn-helix domain-containing protein [Flavobacterium sp. CS20]QTY27152.1 helix-turn-helix transcriptional regulator [Flavobacterium sp. CS20]